MSRVFLSYRRADTSEVVDELDAHLVERFGRKNIYRDISSIQPGDDWVQALEAAVLASDVMIVVIGSAWLGPQPQGRRIDDRHDAVRVEISTAIRARLPIIPVLVDGASMPRVDELPLNVAQVARLNAMSIRSTTIDADASALVNAISRLERRTVARGGLFAKVGGGRALSRDLQGNWVSTGAGDAVLQYTFHDDGTYEYVGTLRQERRSGSMLFEIYQSGEYDVSRRTLKLTAYRSTTSRRDPDFPSDDYVDRPEAVKRSEFDIRIEQPRVLVMTDREGTALTYQRL